MNFGADAAGGTPDADSILAQPPLQEESPAKEETSSQAAESKDLPCTLLFDIRKTYVLTFSSF